MCAPETPRLRALVAYYLRTLLLGRLGMSVDQALKEYGDIGEKVFSHRKSGAHEGVFKATLLESAIKDVVRRFGNATQNADENLSLLSDGQGGSQCKVSVSRR